MTDLPPNEESPVENEQPDNQPSEAEVLRQELEDLKDKYLRLYADFDNHKKRALKEKMEIIDTAARNTINALLPALDDFERARLNSDGFSEGVSLVYQKFTGILRQMGLEGIDTNGQPFDPEVHEAVTEIPAPSEDMKGKVIDTIERAYKLNGHLIRYAKVVVGK